MTCLGLIYIYFIIPETVTKKDGKIEFCQKCSSSLIDGYKYYRNNVLGIFSFFIKIIHVYFQELTETSAEWIAQIVVYSINHYNFYWNGEYQKFWIHVYTKGIWMGCFRLYLFYMVDSKYCIFLIIMLFLIYLLVFQFLFCYGIN